MILRRCEFCNKKIKTKYTTKRFCNAICQRKHYNRRPEIREKYKMRMRKYRRDNPEWREKHRILAVTKYREKRREYWKEIIESLKPFPEEIEKFEIDHIIPLHTFDLTKKEEVKRAFSTTNLQWLTKEENRRKSGKILIGKKPIKIIQNRIGGIIK